MKKRILSFFLSMLMVMTLCMGFVMDAHAEENVEMDIVMVLDQSGSMKKNDPNRLMLEATQMLVGMMPSRTSRAGIITFNRKRTVVQPLTDLNDLSKMDSISKNVNAIKYEGDTDIGNAVADAVDMFDLKDGRVHAVLVLSDGKNDFKGQRDKEVESDENLTDALKKSKNAGAKIYCLGFGKEMSNTAGVGYKKLSSIASSPNNISTENDPEKIQEFYLKMLSELTGGSVVPITNNIVDIKNNVKEANIYIRTQNGSSFDNIDLSIKDPSGNDIPLNKGGDAALYKYKYSAVIKLFNPNPGKYTIQANSDQITISTIYMPIYEYVLSSKLVDASGIEISNVRNHEPVRIQTTILQDGKNISDPEVYNNIKEAVAIITAKDTGDEQTAQLSSTQNGLEGAIEFDHEATYDISICVTSDVDSFSLTDTITITSSKQPAVIGTQDGEKKTLADQKLNKTLKKRVEKTIPNADLMSIVEDPDQVGVEIADVSSMDEDKVEVSIDGNGNITIIGKKWGSSLVTVTYKDTLGNSFDSSFKVKVIDYLLIAFFAMIPVILIIIALIIIYFIMKKSRIIKGNVVIDSVTVNLPGGQGSVMITNTNEYPYLAKQFFGRKATLGNGMMKFAQETYSHNNSSDGQLLYQLMKDDSCEMIKNLHNVKIIGSYLGLNGCTMKIKKGTKVSLNNNQSYGKSVSLPWKRSSNFRVFTVTGNGIEAYIDGQYILEQPRSNRNPKSQKGRKGKGQNQTYQPGNQGFSGNDGFGDNDDPFNFDSF